MHSMEFFNRALSIGVPISEFNKGKASKIFDDVEKDGLRIVYKNNKPVCVLLKPEDYKSLLESVEFYESIIDKYNAARITKKDNFFKKMERMVRSPFIPDTESND